MNERPIINPPRTDSGLFRQPRRFGAARERDEAHNRERFANHFHYADQYCGNTRTFDEQGDYNCGRCNQAYGDKCLLLDIKSIDLDAGSCAHWEDIYSGDAEMPLHELTPEVASYGIAENGKGFGCHRCPYASKAYEEDSQGRDLYCGKGDFRVFGDACCALNGAPTVEDENSLPKHFINTLKETGIWSNEARRKRAIEDYYRIRKEES